MVGGGLLYTGRECGGDIGAEGWRRWSLPGGAGSRTKALLRQAWLASLVFQRNNKSPSVTAILERGEARNKLTTSCHPSVTQTQKSSRIFFILPHIHPPHARSPHHLQVYPKWEAPGTRTVRAWAAGNEVYRRQVTKPLISITPYTWLSTYKQHFQSHKVGLKSQRSKRCEGIN